MSTCQCNLSFNTRCLQHELSPTVMLLSLLHGDFRLIIFSNKECLCLSSKTSEIIIPKLLFLPCEIRADKKSQATRGTREQRNFPKSSGLCLNNLSLKFSKTNWAYPSAYRSSINVFLILGISVQLKMRIRHTVA